MVNPITTFITPTGSRNVSCSEIYIFWQARLCTQRPLHPYFALKYRSGLLSIWIKNKSRESWIKVARKELLIIMCMP